MKNSIPEKRSESLQQDQINPKSFRFGLRVLLLIVLVAACVLAVWRVKEDRKLRRQRAIQALDELAMQPTGWSFPTVPLIKTVNTLSALGRNQAIAVIEEYHATHPVTDFDMRAATGSRFYQTNPSKLKPTDPLWLVVPMLFETNYKDHKPPLKMFLPGYEMEGSIPFSGDSIYTSLNSESRDDLLQWLSWAKTNARFRGRIVPDDNPCLAAETLSEQLLFRGVDFDLKEGEWGVVQHVRVQAYNAVKHLFQNVEDGEDRFPDDDADWKRLVESCSKMQTYWDHNSQQYRARYAPPP